MQVAKRKQHVGCLHQRRGRMTGAHHANHARVRDRVLNKGTDRRFSCRPKASVRTETQTSRPIDELVRRMSAQYAHVWLRVAGSRTQLRPRRVGSYARFFSSSPRIFLGTFAPFQTSHHRKQLRYRCNEPEQLCSISGTGNRCSSTAWSARQGHPELSGLSSSSKALQARSPANLRGFIILRSRISPPR